MKFLKKFYRPFLLTYIFLSIAISFYPSFDFYSLKGQILIIAVSFFNGAPGVDVTTAYDVGPGSGRANEYSFDCKNTNIYSLITACSY